MMKTALLLLASTFAFTCQAEGAGAADNDPVTNLTRVMKLQGWPQTPTDLPGLNSSDPDERKMMQREQQISLQEYRAMLVQMQKETNQEFEKRLTDIDKRLDELAASEKM